ncbi:MAG: hypothetical protein ACO1N9_02340 [Flavobacterium sp.]|uniref:hypothetical protein n=1 Tax=Flavobacterium sp. J372 TaxID=2898436 RepID=UPI002150FAE5|nr:hypothetical protein [Flavobacterium sp. J372]MCR5862606.1 hypothetical protein [Flavobacterium sp. J372]MDC7217391.1 hypothetical protein [Spirochaetales bacterium]
MKKITTILSLLFTTTLLAQIDPVLLRRIPKDTVKNALNMDAVYDRPFLGIGKLPVSVGGYAEVNWQRLSTDGVSEGHQFEFRRMTLFVSSTISTRIKFLSELEFEEGGKEIAIEFAAIDMELIPLANLRAGIILNPIGSFNQNHDGPKWEFTDRPISSTEMLPSTWSNAGFGIYGKEYSKDWMYGYELYLSGSFDDRIIDNNLGRTSLPASKLNPERFEAINSGIPLFTGKVSVRNSKYGELGVSYMGGVFNKFEEDGLALDKKRRVDVYALDYNNTLPWIDTFITAEWAWVWVDVPETFGQQYGSRQMGGFADIVQPIIRRKILDWENASVNLACRFEYVDYNVGKFNETGHNIGDQIWSIMPAISFRPSARTVLRLNYRILEATDLIGNPPSLTKGFSFGLSTYF